MIVYHVYYMVMRQLKELKKVNSSDFLTVDEAAMELGIKPTAVRNYLSAGIFTTFKFKTLTLVKREEIDSRKKHLK